MKLIIDCKDIHTKKLIKQYIEDIFYLKTSCTENKIIVCGNIIELNKIEDKIYTVANMWKDIKINSTDII